MLNEQQNESSFNVQSVDRIERSEENLPTPIVINESNTIIVMIDSIARNAVIIIDCSYCCY